MLFGKISVGSDDGSLLTAAFETAGSKLIAETVKLKLGGEAECSILTGITTSLSIGVSKLCG